MTKLEKSNRRSLDQLEFPLSFLACAHQLTDMSRMYTSLGYADYWGFYTGRSRFNGSLYGWGGHTENGSSYGSVNGKSSCSHTYYKQFISFLDILAEVSFDWAKIIHTVSIANTEHEKISVPGHDIIWSKVPIFPACQRIDLVDQFDLQQHKPQQIFFHISILDDVEVTLFIEERNKALKMRPLKSNMLSYLGPSLKTEGTQRHTRVMLSLSQDLDTEHNPDKGCRHYPYGGFSSYADCDEHFVYQQFKDKFKLMPFWATKEVKEVTMLKFYKNAKYENTIIEDFIDGTKMSPCVKPCLTTKVCLIQCI